MIVKIKYVYPQPFVALVGFINSKENRFQENEVVKLHGDNAVKANSSWFEVTLEITEYVMINTTSTQEVPFDFLKKVYELTRQPKS